MGSVPTGTAMEAAVKEACVRAVQLLDLYAPVEILCERHTEREPHPGSQKPSTSAHASPGTGSPTPVSWSRSHWTRRYSDPHCDGQSFTTMESHSAWRSPPILLRKSWLRNSEPSSSTPGRLRAGAGSRARDYYDLWRILGASPVRLDVSDFEALLREKCATRSVAFSGPDSFFPEAMLANVEKTWAQWLGPLVPDLPSYERVVADLRPLIERLLSNKE